MNNLLMIEALEFFYEKEIPSQRNDSDGIESDFQILAKRIQTQLEIIKLKKQENIDTKENEETFKNLKRYWINKTNNPEELINNFKEELKNILYWAPIFIQTMKENSWSDDEIMIHQKRLDDAKEKIKFVANYLSKDIVKITGVQPF